MEYKAVFRDKSGKELQAGDYVVFAHLLGRSAGMRYGKVTRVQWSKEGWRGIKAPKLQVQGINDDYCHMKDWTPSQAKLNTRKSTLGFPTRVVKIEKDQMPEEFWKLLEGVEEFHEPEPVPEPKSRLDKI
jgi:hypothetical protein